MAVERSVVGALVCLHITHAEFPALNAWFNEVSTHRRCRSWTVSYRSFSLISSHVRITAVIPSVHLPRPCCMPCLPLSEYASANELAAARTTIFVVLAPILMPIPNLSNLPVCCASDYSFSRCLLLLYYVTSLLSQLWTPFCAHVWISLASTNHPHLN